MNKSFSAIVKNASLALIVAAALPIEARSEQATAPQCTVSSSIAALAASFPRTMARLERGEAVTIVAIGSSSTFGLGATTSAGSYPSRLEALLMERYPAATIRVLNRGVNGEDTSDMLARFHKDVVAQKPDLVLWQVGTNDVLGGSQISGATPLIRKGIRQLKATGADVVLMDPQYAPAVLKQPTATRMVDLISGLARDQHVGVFHRFALMRDWHDMGHLPFDAFVTADGLHMNDFGYDCIARQLVAAITTPPAALTVSQR